jgi:hypothetical protein
LNAAAIRSSKETASKVHANRQKVIAHAQVAVSILRSMPPCCVFDSARTWQSLHMISAEHVVHGFLVHSSTGQ